MLKKNKYWRLYQSINRMSTWVCACVLILFVSSCGDTKSEKTFIPTPAVAVYAIKTEQIGYYREFVARTLAAKEANLTARIEGELIERHFKEGAIVEKGQLLLKIDPAAYLASLASAKADLASKQAVAERAEKDLVRGRKIAGQGYISSADLDKLIANAAQAQAAITVAQSTLEKAELYLSYTNIGAPFTGRIGKVNYNIGNVVNPSSGVLATLIATDPMYVSFQVEESAYVSYLQSHSELEKPQDLAMDIKIRLPNNSLYNQAGLLDFAGTEIAPGTGTVELRALFANPDGIILPGLFVTLMLENKHKQAMSLVPQLAVQENQQGKFVLVLNEQDIVQQRYIVLGRRINAMWVVNSGLTAGEKVIVAGLQKVSAGLKVQPVEKALDPLTGTLSDKVN